MPTVELNREILSQVGNLVDEMNEAKKLSKKPDSDIITLTVGCSAFFTIVCC